MNQFKETLNRFKPALAELDYSTYWEWMLIPDDYKAAALYVQFYDAIALAWSKTQRPFIEEETAISTLMQYLIKNVEIIKENRKRFTPNYMYKVAFNAFYPLGRIQRDIDYFYNEHRSPIGKDSSKNGDSLDNMDDDNYFYCESVYFERGAVADKYFEERLVDQNIWAIIESCDDDTQRVIEYLLGGRKLGKKLSAKFPAVIAELRIKLGKYRT